MISRALGVTLFSFAYLELPFHGINNDETANFIMHKE